MREHLAGDVIGKNQPEVEVGTSFLVAGPYDDVGNQDPVAAAQIRADTLDEMGSAPRARRSSGSPSAARVVTITNSIRSRRTRDYYAIYATFAGTVHGERPVATAEAHQAYAEKTNQSKRKKST